ncbi:MAG: hypothetical protein AAGU19_03880 [Prolixibacteraceae bacterium]
MMEILSAKVLKYHVLAAFFSLCALCACSQEENEAETGRVMVVKNYEGHVFVDFFGDEQNLQIGLYPCGVNRLFGIAEVSYFASRASHHRGEPSNRFLSCTDWIGPYYVCDFVNRQAGLPQRFTGGWHGANGDGTGTPTAATERVSIQVDGQVLTGNFERGCHHADLTVINLIRGYDDELSKKYLLKESVHYQLKPDREIAVQVTVEALDDVIIQRYYGLQSQNFAIFDTVKYCSDKLVTNAAGTDMYSGSSLKKGINTIVLTDGPKQHELRLVLCRTEGLGTLEYVADGLPAAFSASYHKSYFNLVNGRELWLKQGEKAYWKGAYIWDAPEDSGMHLP